MRKLFAFFCSCAKLTENALVRKVVCWNFEVLRRGRGRVKMIWIIRVKNDGNN